MISKSRAIELVVSYHIYNHNGNCPSCGQPVSWPYRRGNIKNEVIEGCISVHHSVNDAWSKRPSARAWRRGQAEGLLERWTPTELEQLDELGNEAYSNLVR